MTTKLFVQEEPAIYKVLLETARNARKAIGDIVVSDVAQTGPSCSGEFDYIDIGSVNNLTKQIEAPKRLLCSEAPSRARQRVRAGDVLVSMTRPNLNAVALVPHALDGATASTGFHVLRADMGAEPAWLFHAVQSPQFVTAMSELVQGALYPAVRPKDIRAFPLFVPTKAAQRKVVAYLDEQLSRLDASVAALHRVQTNLKRYRASVLKAACEGRLVPTEAELARQEGRDFETGAQLLARASAQRVDRSVSPPETKGLLELPEAWALASVDMVGDVLLGRQRAPQYLTGESTHCYLRVANIKDDRVDFDDLNEMDFDSSHFAKYQLEPGDILVSEGQSPELLGQSAVFRGYNKPLCFQKTLHRFRAYVGLVTPEFAQLVFRSHLYSGVFRKFGSITTNIGHLTLNRFKAVWFPLPPLAEQHRIVAEADRRLSLIRVAEAQVAANLARAQRLRQSILQAAFSGPSATASIP